MIKENIKFEASNIFEGMPSISAVIRSIECGKVTDKYCVLSLMKTNVDQNQRKFPLLSRNHIRWVSQLNLQIHPPSIAW